MAQVTIYVPDRVATAAKRQAAREGKSVSAWIVEVLERQVGTRRWPKALVDVLSSGSADLAIPDDPPADEDLE